LADNHNISGNSYTI